MNHFQIFEQQIREEKNEIRELKMLLKRAADALEESCQQQGIVGAPLIDELRKVATR